MNRVPALSTDLTDALRSRKGATRTAAVPPEVLTALNAGLLETVNLVEWLVVDQYALAETVFHEQGWSQLCAPLASVLAELPVATAPKRLAAIARFLTTSFPSDRDGRKVIDALAGHRSDVVRSWGATMVGLREDWTLRERLQRIQPFADDANMGVRETAWLAVRDGIAAELDLALEILSAWTRQPSANLRRFASEATRPRGVWCRHLTMLRRNPRPALPLILEPLRADPSKYVRDSVANWLNDASKDHPDWVRETCERWRLESPVPATEGIIRRALRTLRSALEKESA